MLILNTIPVKKIWGGKKLKAFSEEKIGSSLGQLYTVAAQNNLESTIINGPFKGMSLLTIWENNKNKFGFSGSDKFPLLIGLVDAKENLSVQVHPDDCTAKKLENQEFGKEESWFFIDAPDKIINGCKTKDINKIEEYTKNNQWENIIDYLPVKKNSYVHVNAGTLHALTSGSLVYEIQQASDLTYRFYDYNRQDKNGNKRPLHLNKALKSLKPELKSKNVPFNLNQEFHQKNYSISLKELENEKLYNNLDVFKCFTVIDGTFNIEDSIIKKGTSFILMPKETVLINGSGKVIIASPTRKN